MKKKLTVIKKLAVAVLLATPQAFAGGGESASVVAEKGGPLVPIEVAIKGRQKITEYLKATIDHVQVQFLGDSIVGAEWQNFRYLDRNSLRHLGYVHDGSFPELGDAMFSVAFSGEVVPTPGGYYDVRAWITMYDTNNYVALYGSGYLDVYRDGGVLNVGKFEPYVSITEHITMVVPGEFIAAKWVGNTGNSEELYPWFDGRNTLIVASSSKLENGFLLLADNNGHITGFDLTTGARLSGQRIYALLGPIRSGDVENLINPETIAAGRNGFSSYGKMILGRFPSRDLVLSFPFNKRVSFAVPVWGQRNGSLAPSRMWVTPIYINGPSDMRVGVEYEVPKDGSSFILKLQAGEYNMRTEFEGLTDWEEIFGGGIGKG